MAPLVRVSNNRIAQTASELRKCSLNESYIPMACSRAVIHCSAETDRSMSTFLFQKIIENDLSMTDGLELHIRDLIDLPSISYDEF